MGTRTRLLILTTVLLAMVVVGLGACSWRMPWQAAPTDTPQPPADTATPAPPTATPKPEDPPEDTPTPTPTRVVQYPPARSILQAAIDTLAALDAWHLEVEMPLTVGFRGVSINVPTRYSGDYTGHGRMEGELSLHLLGRMVEKELVFESESIGMSDGARGRSFSRRPANILWMMETLGVHPRPHGD